MAIPTSEPATASATAPGATSATAPMSLPARVLGVLFAPRRTYADVVAFPRWFGVFIVIVALTSAVGTAFLSTEVGRNAVIDQQIGQYEAYGRQLNQTQIDRIEQMSTYYKYFVPVFQLLGLIFAALLVAGLSFAVFSAALGSDASFRQTFAVVVHSGVVLVVQSLFSTPLAYARGTLSSVTSLAVFAPFLEDRSFAARLLGSVDLFQIWWIVSLAIGLGVLSRKRTAPIATSLVVIYLAIGVVIAAIKTAVSGA
jgi:hypothetical protein